LESMKVQVPVGMKPGSLMQVTTPDGQTIQAKVPQGLGPKREFMFQYIPLAAAAPRTPGTASNNAASSMPMATKSGLLGNFSNIQGNRMQAVGLGVLTKGLDKASNVVTNRTGKTPEEWSAKASTVVTNRTGKTPEEWLAKAMVVADNSTAEWRSKLTTQAEAAMGSSDYSSVNRLLDSALAGAVMREGAPDSVRRAANWAATRQLNSAISSADPKQLKGALVAAKRLNATEVPEFTTAAQKYKEVRKLPPGFDVEKMALNRTGQKMVAKTSISDAALISKFQQLLDLTYRKVYTRDRLGQPVPGRLEVLHVTTVTNADIWGDYMARREAIRQEIEADAVDFAVYPVDTVAGAAAASSAVSLLGADGASGGADTVATAAAQAGGETAEEITAGLAEEFGTPLMQGVNEVFLFHGTSESAADKIASANYNINLAGSAAGSLYGRGIYLAENSTKSDEYTRPDKGGERNLLLCRATLGRVFYSDTKETDPRACESACLSGRFHSVLGDRKKCRGTFREFTVFDEEQVYPNYIIRYQRVDAEVDVARSLQVECPADAAPGTTLQVVAPDGATLCVIVPIGTAPGQKFLVQY